MNFRVIRKEKYSIIASEADILNAINATELKEIISTLNKEDVSNIIIDLTKTSYSNSSGLSAILSANRLCKEADGLFILTGLQPNVRKMIEISQLHRVFTITDSLEEAEKELNA